MTIRFDSGFPDPSFKISRRTGPLSKSIGPWEKHLSLNFAGNPAGGAGNSVPVKTQLPEELKESLLKIDKGKFHNQMFFIYKNVPNRDKLDIFIDPSENKGKIIFWTSCAATRQHNNYDRIITVDLDTFEILSQTRYGGECTVDHLFPLGDLKALQGSPNYIDTSKKRENTAAEKHQSILDIVSDMKKILDAIQEESRSLDPWDIIGQISQREAGLPVTDNAIKNDDPDVISLRELIRLIEERGGQFGQFIS